MATGIADNLDHEFSYYCEQSDDCCPERNFIAIKVGVRIFVHKHLLLVALGKPQTLLRGVVSQETGWPQNVESRMAAYLHPGIPTGGYVG
jgi:hypothetical protein